MDKRINKAYVRYDKNGRIIPGGPILSRLKPKVGKWVESSSYQCCNPIPANVYTVGFDFSSGGAACSSPIITFNVYSADNPLIIGSFVYPNSDLTGLLADGYIAFDGNYYQVYGNEIIDIQPCVS